jgi:DSP-PTPase phosphatase fused to NAD+ Kinase
MNTMLRTKLCIGAIVVLQLLGCSHVCKRQAFLATPSVSAFPAPAAPVYANLTPQPIPARPPAAPDIRLYAPEWRAVPDGGAGTREPPLAPPDAGRPGVRLLPPASEPARTSEPEPSRSPPSLPVGIPEFAMAKDRIASGLKPLLDGLDWLQTNGYRTVLHLRSPGQDDSADRREVEKRGLKYVSLEVSPQTLSRGLLEQFNSLVTDAALQPLFVYDKDGVLAGGLWYLHFRTHEKSVDEVARTRASRLGLRPEGDGEQRTMWLAIQKLLADVQP